MWWLALRTRGFYHLVQAWQEDPLDDVSFRCRRYPYLQHHHTAKTGDLRLNLVEEFCKAPPQAAGSFTCA